jgi:hypothetical protein
MEGVSNSQQSEIRLHVQIREKILICTADKEKKEECAVECVIQIFCVCISCDPGRSKPYDSKRLTQN